LIGRRVQSSNQPRAALISSIVFDEDFQPFGVGDALALKEDNVLISETAQANEPKKKAASNLFWAYGDLFKNVPLYRNLNSSIGF